MDGDYRRNTSIHHTTRRVTNSAARAVRRRLTRCPRKRGSRDAAARIPSDLPTRVTRRRSPTASPPSIRPRRSPGRVPAFSKTASPSRFRHARATPWFSRAPRASFAASYASRNAAGVRVCPRRAPRTIQAANAPSPSFSFDASSASVERSGAFERSTARDAPRLRAGVSPAHVGRASSADADAARRASRDEAGPAGRSFGTGATFSRTATSFPRFPRARGSGRALSRAPPRHLRRRGNARSPGSRRRPAPRAPPGARAARQARRRRRRARRRRQRRPPPRGTAPATPSGPRVRLSGARAWDAHGPDPTPRAPPSGRRARPRRGARGRARRRPAGRRRRCPGATRRAPPTRRRAAGTRPAGRSAAGRAARERGRPACFGSAFATARDGVRPARAAFPQPVVPDAVAVPGFVHAALELEVGAVLPGVAADVRGVVAKVGHLQVHVRVVPPAARLPAALVTGAAVRVLLRLGNRLVLAPAVAEERARLVAPRVRVRRPPRDPAVGSRIAPARSCHRFSCAPFSGGARGPLLATDAKKRSVRRRIASAVRLRCSADSGSAVAKDDVAFAAAVSLSSSKSTL